jgi:hypothetical protein
LILVSSDLLSCRNRIGSFFKHLELSSIETVETTNESSKINENEKGIIKINFIDS